MKNKYLEHANLVYSWLPPPPNLTLSSNDIHLWGATLDQPALWVQQLAQPLSEEERRKAECFHFEQDRKRFIVGRGVLRTILGLYLGTEPNRLEFCYGHHGKPYLAERFGEGALRFNLAHSYELALYAFTRGREIGVDLEYMRYMPDAEQIAASFFSARENAILHALPTSQKQEAFFNCWTRKEAYIKAIGNGLAQPLDKFDVSLAPGEPACLLNVEGAPEEASRWSLKALTPAPGYVAAMAVEGHNWRLTYWQFPEAT
jgi:4'-phosphopantetheinyl transferase